MASPLDCKDEIYLEPYEELDETNHSFSTSRSKIEGALQKTTKDKSKVTGYSKNTNCSAGRGHIKKRVSNYENIDDTTGVNLPPQPQNTNDDTMLGIYFTPEDVPGESPQLREAASSKHDKSRRSRYDSNMYALPDSPTGSTTTSTTLPDSSSPQTPSENGRSRMQRFWERKRRSITIVIIALCFLIFLSSGTGVVITVMSRNDTNDTGNEIYRIKYRPFKCEYNF